MSSPDGTTSPLCRYGTLTRRTWAWNAGPTVCALTRGTRPAQFEALWALTNIASGTSEDTEAVVEGGAAGIAVNCLGLPTSAVREQATWLLGNISGDTVQMRNSLLDMGVVDPLVVNMQREDRDAHISLLRNTVWTVSNLCRGKPHPPIDQVVAFVVPLTRLLHSDDTEVLVDACWALSYITDGNNERIQPFVEAGGIPQIVGMLQHASAVRVAAARGEFCATPASLAAVVCPPPPPPASKCKPQRCAPSATLSPATTGRLRLLWTRACSPHSSA